VKYNKPLIYNQIRERETLESENQDIEDLEQTDTAILIRRELSRLSKIYREVMVQFYMENKSISEIASNLGISQGTVCSRLDMGRKKVKEGINNMDSFGTSSYKPSKLILHVDGSPGVNDEPMSVITNLIDQNILIMAYEKPISLIELSENIGATLAYVEESVEKLLYHELMEKQGKHVYTNFIIIDDELQARKAKAQNDFVDSVFPETKKFFTDLVNEYKKIDVLKKFNDTQFYTFAINMTSNQMVNNIANKTIINKREDYPIRPNGGKWLILYGQIINNPKYIGIGQNLKLTHVQDDISYFGFDCKTGMLPHKFNHNLTIPRVFQILHELYCKKNVNQSHMHFIPDFINSSFIKIDKDKNANIKIPVVSLEDYKRIMQIHKDYTLKYASIFQDRIINLINHNKINHPKHIHPVSKIGQLYCLFGLSDVIINKATEDDLFKIEKDINYPLFFIIEGDIEG